MMPALLKHNFNLFCTIVGVFGYKPLDCSISKLDAVPSLIGQAAYRE